VTAILGVIHYIWLVKADLRKPLQYAVVLSVLLLYRVILWALELRKKFSMTSVPSSAKTSEV